MQFYALPCTQLQQRRVKSTPTYANSFQLNQTNWIIHLRNVCIWLKQYHENCNKEQKRHSDDMRFHIIDIRLKICDINPGFHFMDNASSSALNISIKTLDINYQLVPSNNHRSNNAERSIQMFKNHFIVRLCSVDENLHLQLKERLL